MTDNPNVYQGQLGDARPNDVQISADGTKIYAAGADGNLYVYSAATGALLNSWDVGTELGAMDLSPDGTFAMVIEAQPVGTYVNQYGETQYVIAVHKVNLATGAVIDFTYNVGGDEYTFADVAVLNNGTVLLTQNILPGYSGAEGGKVLNLSTGQFSSAGFYAYDGILTASSDGSFAVLTETNNSTGMIEIYNPATGSLQPLIGAGYQSGTNAYSDAKGLLAYWVYNDGVHVFDAATQETIRLSAISSNESVFGLSFDQSGQYLFVLDASTDTILQLSTLDWSVVNEFAVGADLNTVNNYSGNMLLVAPDLSYFTVVSETGIIVVDPTASPPPTEGADSLIGTPGADVIDGLGGDDYIKGLAGDDTLHGGAGADRVYGGDGADTLDGGSGQNWLDGGAGNDVLVGGNDGNTLIGGTGSDVLTGGSGADILYSDDLPQPGPGWPDAGTEVDSLKGGAGDDVIFAGYGDNVDGGTDSFGDILSVNFRAAPAGITFDLHNSTQTIGGATITGIERIGAIQGSDYDDYINIASAEVVPWAFDQTEVSGGAGNDTLIGSAHFWYLDGGDGDDIVDGRASASGGGLYGGAGNDTIYAGSSTETSSFGDDGDDTIYGNGHAFGGAGNDTIFLAGSGSEAAYGYVTTDGGDGNDQITGSGQADSITGGTGADRIDGGEGNDFLMSDVGDDGSGPAWQNHYVSLDAGSDHDVLLGGAGDDYIEAGYGDDVDGGTGTDTLRLNLSGATAGVVLNTASLISGTVIGGGTIQNIEQVEALCGTDFADTLTVGAGIGIVNAGAGNDIVNSAADNGQLAGGDGDDSLISTGTGVSFDGGEGNDVISLRGGISYALGDAGDDRFISNGAGHYLYGSTGFDTVDYSGLSAGVSVNLLSQTGAGGDHLVEIEGVKGTAFADTITGSYLDDQLWGAGGNDTLNGDNGNDMLDGGAGTDTMRGGFGDDTYYVDNAGDVVTEALNAGADTVHATINYTLSSNVENAVAEGSSAINLTGNALANILVGNSAANILDGGAGNDTLTGGGGVDTFVYRTGGGLDVITDFVAGEAINIYGYALAQSVVQSGTNVIVTLASGNTLTVNNATVANVTAALHFMASGGGGSGTITGTSGNDTLNGTSGNDIINGLAGNDTLNGNGGNDTLDGGTGADTMKGGAGNDIYYVDSSSDVVTELSGQGSDEVRSTVSYTLGANVEKGTALGTAAINLTGNTLANTLTGNSAANILKGNAGNDTIKGGLGNDTLSGGTGADIFVYTDIKSGADKITDFVSGTDKINLHAFGITASQVHTVVSGSNLVINVDADHNGTNDFSITLIGVTHISASDYIF